MSNIKQAFTSRFGYDGYIMEVDWNQLEVVILQVESGDPVLKRELQEGIDLHAAMTADVYRVPYEEVYRRVKDGDPEWIAKRKKVKSGRFALQYGASPHKIAITTGWTDAEAKHFHDLYYFKYKGIAAWQKAVKKEVQKSKKPIDTYWKGQYISPNGRRYVFHGEWNEQWKMVTFPPTKLQNYPIQGLASDFVKYMRSRLLDSIISADLGDHIKPINTIHDSVLFDVRNTKYLELLTVHINTVYGMAKEFLYVMLNELREVDVPLNYSIKFGSYWR